MDTLTEFFTTRLDAFLECTELGTAALGRRAVGDPNLVRQVREGRSPTLVTSDRVLAFMAAYEKSPTGDFVFPLTGRLRDPSSRTRRAGSAKRPPEKRADTPADVLRLPQVEARTGLSRSTIYVRMAEGSFPGSVALGGGAVGWSAADVDRWIRERIAASRSGPGWAIHPAETQGGEGCDHS